MLLFRLQLTEAEWSIYASVNKTIIGSYKRLSPVHNQAIIWTNDSLLSNGPLKKKEKLSFFFQRNPFENVVSKIVAISQPNMLMLDIFVLGSLIYKYTARKCPTNIFDN